MAAGLRRAAGNVRSSYDPRRFAAARASVGRTDSLRTATALGRIVAVSANSTGTLVAPKKSPRRRAELRSNWPAAALAERGRAGETDVEHPLTTHALLSIFVDLAVESKVRRENRRFFSVQNLR